MEQAARVARPAATSDRAAGAEAGAAEAAAVAIGRSPQVAALEAAMGALEERLRIARAGVRRAGPAPRLREVDASAAMPSLRRDPRGALAAATRAADGRARGSRRRRARRRSDCARSSRRRRRRRGRRAAFLGSARSSGTRRRRRRRREAARRGSGRRCRRARAPRSAGAELRRAGRAAAEGGGGAAGGGGCRHGGPRASRALRPWRTDCCRRRRRDHAAARRGGGGGGGGARRAARRAASCITLAAELALREDERAQHLAAEVRPPRYRYRARARALADLRVHAVRMRRARARPRPSSARCSWALALPTAADNVEAFRWRRRRWRRRRSIEQHSALAVSSSAVRRRRRRSRRAQARKFGRANVAASRHRARASRRRLTAVGAAHAAAGVPLAAPIDGGGVAALSAALPNLLRRDPVHSAGGAAVSRLQAHAKVAMTRADVTRKSSASARYRGGDGSPAAGAAHADRRCASVLGGARADEGGQARRGAARCVAPAVASRKLGCGARSACGESRPSSTADGKRRTIRLASNESHSLPQPPRIHGARGVLAATRGTRTKRARDGGTTGRRSGRLARRSAAVGWESDEAAAEAEAIDSAADAARPRTVHRAHCAAAAGQSAGTRRQARRRRLGTSPHASPRRRSAPCSRRRSTSTAPSPR